MRSLYPVLALVALAGCDRQSPPAPQGNTATPAADADAVQPDEVTAADAPAAPRGGTTDTTHAGTPAPAHRFTDADGRPRTLADFRGRPTLVNLWATWCVPCIRELPALDTLATRMGDRLNVVLLSQDSDTARVAPFVQARNVRAPVYTDGDMAWLPTVTTTLPTTILYGSDGREVWRVVGDRDWTSTDSATAIAQAR